MGKIFISYRRRYDQNIAGRIHENLARHFSSKLLFKDVDSIPPGVDFRSHIDEALKQSAVMLVVISPGWLSASNSSGQRRLEDPTDFVHVEISSALRLKRLIVPVLVDGAQMPTAAELPLPLQQLAYISALPMRPDPDFKGDFAKLRDLLQRVIGRRGKNWIVALAIAAGVLGAGAFMVWKPYPPAQDADKTVCSDVPFTDLTKNPPLITTKRICN